MKYSRQQYSLARQKAFEIFADAGMNISQVATPKQMLEALGKISGLSIQTGGITTTQARRKLVTVLERRCVRNTVQIYATKPSIKQNKTWEQTPSFLRSTQWKALRYQALVAHGGKCQCCGASAKDGAKLNVDHIFPRSTHPSLALDINNLQVLCSSCNEGKSNRDTTDWRPNKTEHLPT